jgi:homoserine dehydrogenase
MNNPHPPSLYAVADSTAALRVRGAAEALAALGDKAIRRPIADLPGAVPLHEVLQQCRESRPPSGPHDRRPLLIDATAADTTDLLIEHVEQGGRAVLANKIPLVGPLSAFHRLDRAGCRWEATVAAALPVVAATQGLIDAGDAPLEIRGTLSGTLGRLAQALEAGERPSTFVRRAMEGGLTEPDPRADLDGRDAARKALILGRMCGWPLDLDSARVESLVPPGLENLSLPSFLAALGSIDAPLLARAAEARRSGRALRYVAHVTAAGVTTSLEALSPDDALAQATAANSCVVLRSALFDEMPLTLSGRTGGPEGAAAAVMRDVIDLQRCL